MNLCDLVNKKQPVKKLLFEFVKCLLEAREVNINSKKIEVSNNVYKHVLNKIFTDIYDLNKNEFVAYLDYEDNSNNRVSHGMQGYYINSIYDDIKNVLDIICHELKKYHFNGGKYMFGKNINTKCNNSIIKKVLIVLLIILIIIIVVLIVLYIINKYKNNNNFK